MDALFRRDLALDLPASVVVFVEHAILTAITLPLAIAAIAKGRHRFTRANLVSLILIGAGSSALATILFTRAFVYGDPSTPLLLQKLQPLFAILGAHVLLGERLRPRYGIFFVLGIGSAYLITFGDPLTISLNSATAAGLALGAALLWAMGTVLGRGLSSTFGFMEITSLRFAIGLPASAAVVMFQGEMGTVGALRGQDLMALLSLALVPGLLALAVYYRGLQDTTASAATLAELAFPLSAIVVNRIAFGTVLTGTQWLGVIVLAGTIVAMSGLSSRRPRSIGVAWPPPEKWSRNPAAVAEET
jgi:drug/metabolite transporter (DMT)-like permease